VFHEIIIKTELWQNLNVNRATKSPGDNGPPPPKTPPGKNAQRNCCVAPHGLEMADMLRN
jgi:hypothetical protein